MEWEEIDEAAIEYVFQCLDKDMGWEEIEKDLQIKRKDLQCKGEDLEWGKLRLLEDVLEDVLQEFKFGGRYKEMESVWEEIFEIYR